MTEIIRKKLRGWILVGSVLVALALVGCGESAEDKAAEKADMDKECQETQEKIALTSSPLLMEWFNENCVMDRGRPVAR